jgi:hypothetical protein
VLGHGHHGGCAERWWMPPLKQRPGVRVNRANRTTRLPVIVQDAPRSISSDFITIDFIEFLS